MKHCVKCGSQLSETAKFCTSCGNRLVIPNEMKNMKSETQVNNMKDQDQKGWLSINWFKLSLVIGVLLAIGVLYNALVTVPREKMAQQEAYRIQQEASAKAQAIDKINQRDECLRIAEMNYRSNWAAACKSQADRMKILGYTNKIADNSGSPDCSLLTGKDVTASYTEQKNLCYKQ